MVNFLDKVVVSNKGFSESGRFNEEIIYINGIKILTIEKYWNPYYVFYSYSPYHDYSCNEVFRTTSYEKAKEVALKTLQIFLQKGFVIDNEIDRLKIKLRFNY